MSKKKWNTRSPIEKGLIIGGSVISTILLFKITKGITDTLAKRKIAKDYAAALAAHNQSITTGQLPPGTPPPPPPIIVSSKIKNLAQNIADKVIGWNIIYYPEIVNKIVDLNSVEIQQLWNYWNKMFNSMAGGDLLFALEDEDAYILQYGFSAHAYAPAIDYLKALGY